MRRHISLRPALWLLLFFLAFALAPPLGTYVGRFSPTPASARAPVYQGYHDYVDCNYVSGWVRDLNSPGTRLGVSVYDDATGAIVASGTANMLRQDLLNAGIGDGRYGFMIPTPAAVKSGQSFSIRVRVTGTAFSLGNTPKTFNAANAGCVIAPSYQGFHDAVTCAAVTGWVRDLNNPTTRLGVSVYDDSNGGALVASGTANQYRQDLASNGFGDGYYGFSIPTPASIKNGLDHSLRVRVTGGTFSLGNTPKTFNSSTACAPPSGPITMTILNRSNDPRHNNFRVQAANMSVSYTPDRYHIYGTGGYDLWRWTPDYLNWDSLYTGAWPYGGGGEDCSHATDPRVWNPRCTSDAIGYFSKRVTCPPGGGVSCQDNDRWDGWPGTYNLTTFAANDVWPNRPNEDFGTRGYAPIMNAGKVNGVQLEPASTDCWQFADTTWVDDTLPRGAIQYSNNETWKWVVASPSPTPFPASPGEPPVPAPTPVSPANPTFSPPPFQSHVSHQSADFDQMHQHYFAGDGTANTIPLKINAGDRLFAYVNINPASPPQEIMLQWHEPPSASLPQGSWEHRAFWGADRIEWGGPNVASPGHRQMSITIPPAGVWHRLEVEAADVGLVGKTIDGMAFTLYDGQATWDRAGKSRPSPSAKCPPKTWTTPERSVHAYNRDEYATGADSGKVVQVKYAGGQTRWFMAFNKQIKHVTTTYQIPNPNAGLPGHPATIPFNASQYGGSAADNWQILWATSPDGANWKVHPQTIIRSVTEQQREHLGPIMMDMLIDGGYFYALFQDGVKPYLYLARAPIDPVYSDTSAGYVQGGWRVAATPLTSGGEYVWKSFTPGARTDFAALGAYQVMRTRLGGDFNADMKQGVIARVTSPTTGASYYFGVTADLRETLQLWKTTSLTRPFQYESNVIVEDTTIDYTPFGWYANFSFNHYPDNDAATPRIFSNGFDWWMVEHKPTGRAIDGWLIVGRHTARLSDF